MAFVQNTTPTCIKQPMNGKVQILPADTTANKTVYTAGASGSKVNALTAQSTDTAAHDIQIAIVNAGTTYPIGVVTVPIGAGNSGSVPSVNLLAAGQVPGLPIDSDGNEYILLQSGDTLVVSALVTVTTAKAITVIALSAGDF